MSIMRVYNSFSGSTPLAGIQIDWPGGDGWVVIDTGTFSGAAVLAPQFIPSAQAWQFGANVPFSIPITGPGVYPFSAPKGQLNLPLNGTGSVSNLSAYVLTIP